MALNVELFRKVQEAITREAETFNMSMTKHWDSRGCATPACIAGHAAFIVLERDAKKFREKPVLTIAMKSLGLTDDSFFTVDTWPYRFCRRYRRAVRPATRARVACQYIDWLIEREASHGTSEL
jgi:hypothetical protein